MNFNMQSIHTSLVRVAPGRLVGIPLCAFVLAVMGLVPSFSVAVTQEGDADRGHQLFDRRCGGCHSLDSDKEGPRLRGVYGRKAGTVPTFKYSDAVAKSGVTWDDSNLDKWLTDPDKFIPDADMDFHLEKADERADVIAYLKQLSSK
jgi:cytochrome c